MYIAILMTDYRDISFLTFIFDITFFIFLLFFANTYVCLVNGSVYRKKNVSCNCYVYIDGYIRNTSEANRSKRYIFLKSPWKNYLLYILALSYANCN